MDGTVRGWLVGLVAALGALVGGCGGGGGGSFSELDIAVLTINGPFAAGAEEAFILRGDFSHLVGAGVEVRFVVEDGEPFPVGPSSVDTERSNVGRAAATVTSDRTIEGVTPAARFCGPTQIAATVQIVVSGGPATQSATPIAIFVSQSVVGMQPSQAPAAVPTPLTLTTDPLARSSGSVTAHWRSAGGALFAGGKTEGTSLGSILSNTSIHVSSPSTVLCGTPSAEAILDHIVLADGSCLSGGEFVLRLDGPVVTALHNDEPAGGARVGRPEFVAAQQERIVVEGAGFGPLGGSATLTFVARSGTPFESGTLASVSVPGFIEGDGVIRALSPTPVVCGDAALDTDVLLTLQGGSCANVPGAVQFLAPMIDQVDDGAGGTTFSAVARSQYRIKGSGFGPVGGVAIVTFASTATGDGSKPFNGGIAGSTTVAGLILDEQTIEGLTPTLRLCPTITTAAGCHALSVGVDVAVRLPGGSCTAQPWSALTFDGPTIQSLNGSGLTSPVVVVSTPILGSGGAPATFTLVGAGFGPIGSSAVVTFEDASGATPFNGATKGTSVATIADASTLTGSLPTMTQPRLTSDITVRLRVTLLDGSCAFCNSAVTFKAPPSIDAVVAGVAVAGADGPAFLTRCPTTMRIEGSGFDAAATHAILVDGSTSTIGSGLLTAPEIQGDLIRGFTPVDATATSDRLARVRVVNPDDQFDEFQSADFEFLATGRLVNVNATQRTGHNAGMECWIDPDDARNLAILTHEDAGSGETLVLLRSADAGATFSTTPIDNTVDGLGSVARRAPRVAGDRFGNLYLCYVAATSPARIVCLHSKDGGATVAVQRTVATDANGGLLDPFLAVGPNGANAAEACVYVGWTDTGTHATGTSTIVVAGARIRNASASLDAFATPVAVSDALTTAILGAAAVDDGGGLLVLFHGDIADQGAGPLLIRSDFDADGLFGAAAFGADALVGSVNVGHGESITPQPGSGVTPGTSVTAIRSGANAGRFVLAYGDEIQDGTGDLDVFVRVSDDGTTWSAPLRIDGAPGTRAQFHPVVRADPKTGVLACLWHDARDGTAGRTVAMHASVSTDAGTTWRASQRVADASSDEGTMTSTRAYGPYAGLAMAGGSVFCVWADNADATEDNPDGSAATDVLVTRLQ